MSAIITLSPLNSRVPTKGFSYQLQPFESSLLALALQTHTRDGVAGHVLLTAGKPLHPLYMDLRAVVVVIDKVTGSPDEARCSSFRLHFLAEFHLPLGAVFVFDLKLGRSSALRIP